MSEDRAQDRPERDHTGARRQRVSVLKDLVERRGYQVAPEDVAASIIRDAIVVSAHGPAPKRLH